MVGSVNKVMLIGNLGADPEVRSFPNGGQVVRLRLATSEAWKDKNTGERRERTEWHSISIFNEALGRIATQYLKKGATVYLEGQLETRKWQDQSGNDRYSTEVVLRPYRGNLTLLGGRERTVYPDPRPNNQTQATSVEGDPRPSRTNDLGSGLITKILRLLRELWWRGTPWGFCRNG